MNIEEIKERVGLREHMKSLCNNPNMLTNWVGSINYNNAEDDVIYLLSIIEQARKVLEWYSDDTTYENYGEGIEIWEDKGKLAKQALKAIQGDE